MSGWSTHTGTAVALDIENVDTDQLIPARFMSTPRNDGYGPFLLHDLRFDSDGNPIPVFPLNRAPDASILIAKRNFGSGSSREAAVYALADFGIRAVIAPSFGDIFSANAANNGLLPARVDTDIVDELIHLIGERPATASVDLETGRGAVAGNSFDFELDAVSRVKLMSGWDDIDLTEQHRPAIAAFRARRADARAWTFPAGERAG